MAMALNPLWNYKPRTQRIKLLLQRSSSGVTFLAWHFRYSHRFPDPGLKRLRPATQHLAINILQAYLKYPEKYCRSFTPGAQCHCYQFGTSRELSLMLSWCWVCWPTQARTQFPLKSKHSNTSQPQELYLSVYLSIYLPIYGCLYIYAQKYPTLSGWKNTIQGQVLTSQQKNTFEFKRPFAEGIIISRIQEVLLFFK